MSINVKMHSPPMSFLLHIIYIELFFELHRSESRWRNSQKVA